MSLVLNCPTTITPLSDWMNKNGVVDDEWKGFEQNINLDTTSNNTNSETTKQNDLNTSIYEMFNDDIDLFLQKKNYPQFFQEENRKEDNILYCKDCNDETCVIENSIVICKQCSRSVMQVMEDKEWRNFQDDNREDPCRVGQNCKGLFSNCPKTFISYRHGESNTMRDIRLQHIKTRCITKGKSRLKRIINLQEIAYRYKIPKSVVNCAKNCLYTINECQLHRGENNQGIAPACLYRVCKMKGCPQTVQEIADMFSVSVQTVRKGIKYFDGVYSLLDKQKNLFDNDEFSKIQDNKNPDLNIIEIEDADENEEEEEEEEEERAELSGKRNEQEHEHEHEHAKKDEIVETSENTTENTITRSPKYISNRNKVSKKKSTSNGIISTNGSNNEMNDFVNVKFTSKKSKSKLPTNYGSLRIGCETMLGIDKEGETSNRNNNKNNHNNNNNNNNTNNNINKNNNHGDINNVVETTEIKHDTFQGTSFSITKASDLIIRYLSEMNINDHDIQDKVKNVALFFETNSFLEKNGPSANSVAIILLCAEKLNLDLDENKLLNHARISKTTINTKCKKKLAKFHEVFDKFLFHAK